MKNQIKITIKLGNEIHEVIYIEYGDKNRVHSAITEDKYGLTSWDFFDNNGDKTDVRFYNSGGGGDKKKIQAPNWVEGFKGKYWLSDGAKLKGKSNGIQLQKPMRVKGYKCSSINPFKIGEETNCREYCEECGYESTEFCYKHKYEDSEGNERWIHNNEYSG